MNFLKKTFFAKEQKKIQSKISSTQPIQPNQNQKDVPIQILTEIFEKSAKFIGETNKSLSDQNKLAIYGLYKQATIGDCNTPKPGLLDFVGKSKWTAWSNNKGMPKYQAMNAYISKAVEIDSQIQEKMKKFLQGQSQLKQQKQRKPKQSTSAQSGLGLKIVQQKDYSSTYSHPYFKAIEQNLLIPQSQVTKQLLLEVNNSPKCYPLHFAIDKQRVKLVQQFVKHLQPKQISQMLDEDGTSIEEYAQLIQNQEIIKIIKQKMK